MKCISVQTPGLGPAHREVVLAQGRTLDADLAAMPYGGDRWTLRAQDHALGLAQTPSVFTISNGYIGVRGPGDPSGAPRVYLNGVFEKTPIHYHEAAHGFARASDTRMAVADATRIEIVVDGEPATVAALELDFRRGVLRETRRAGGVTAHVETLVSMRRTGVVAFRVTLSAAHAATVHLAQPIAPPPDGARAAERVYDPRVAPVPARNPWIVEHLIDEANCRGRVDRLACSGFVVAAVARTFEGTIPLGAGETRLVDGFAAYAADRSGAPMPLAEQVLADGFDLGFDALAAEQAEWFAQHWRGAEIAFPANLAAEQALRHGQFQLVQGVGRDGLTSLAAKGQSGEGYEGHVFWDAEIYALPMFVHTAPAIARAMLVWRIGGLAKARENARLMGHAKGALYPWRTIAGAECSAFFLAGAAQYHLNADIAYALKLYVNATGDRSILAEGGAEMLAETARIWLQIGFYDAERGGAFVINRVTGPDEYSALVNNNLYTNLMAAEHLRFAADVGRVDAREAAAMRRAADAMFMPHDAAHGVPAQDDGFFALDPWPFETTPASDYPLLLHYHPLSIYRHRVAKQADAVLAAALLPKLFDSATKRRMLDVYEAVTVHDSTLSASAFATLAAQVGETARAARYWRATALTDLCDLFGNSGHGLHMAALAGGWNALAFGFAGLHTAEGSLAFAPRFSCELGPYGLTVHFHRRRIHLDVGPDEVRYELQAGEPVEFTHCGEALMLTTGVPTVRALTR
jgi:trehalose/maltose hydrolase-like predicted phosphorylase